MKCLNPLPSLCMKCVKSKSKLLPFAAAAAAAAEKSGTNRYNSIIPELINAPF